jgi:hypothetical protein
MVVANIPGLSQTNMHLADKAVCGKPKLAKNNCVTNQFWLLVARTKPVANRRMRCMLWRCHARAGLGPASGDRLWLVAIGPGLWLGGPVLWQTGHSFWGILLVDGRAWLVATKFDLWQEGIDMHQTGVSCGRQDMPCGRHGLGSRRQYMACGNRFRHVADNTWLVAAGHGM